jgi:pyruvate dehydrogenase E1 component
VNAVPREIECPIARTKTFLPNELAILGELERKVLWLASWTIHNANHLRESVDGLKVGGHQASSASLATIMTALYFRSLRPQDRVAVKPHASPKFSRDPVSARQADPRQAGKLPRLQGRAELSVAHEGRRRRRFLHRLGRPRRGADAVLVAGRRTTCAPTAGVSTGRKADDRAGRRRRARRGNIFEAILEGWKQGLRNCWWIIDYNRQSLDAVVREGLWERYEQLFKNFGWDVVILKYGSLQQAAFREPGRRDPAAVDRPLPEPALLGAGVSRAAAALAQAPDGRDR